MISEGSAKCHGLHHGGGMSACGSRERLPPHERLGIGNRDADGSSESFGISSNAFGSHAAVPGLVQAADHLVDGRVARALADTEQRAANDRCASACRCERIG